MKTANLLSRVEATLQKYKMLIPGDRILIACSGGPDSVALAYLLKELASRMNLRLALLHFDHRLRKESAKDLQFVRLLASRLRLPFYGGRAQKVSSSKTKNVSPEEKARELRYAFFRSVARRTGIRKVALAHHKDDQAETVLMRLVQGTGLRGLQGIRPVVREGGVSYFRPLIELTRQELRRFLAAKRIRYREDPTNRSLRFLRNRVRHRLLPLLEKEFNPRVGDLLARLAETASRELKGLEDWVGKRWRIFVESKKNGTLRLDRDLFLFLPETLQFRILDRALQSLDRRSGLDFKSWGTLREGFRRGRVRMTLPRDLDLNLTAKKLFVRVCLRQGSEK